MGDSTTTTKVVLPEATPEEKANLALANQVMLAAAQQAGYDITRTEKTFDQSADYKRIQERRSVLNSAMEKVKDTPADARFPGRAIGPANQERVRISQELAALDREEADKRKSYKPEISYETRRRDSLEVENIREKFGADSPEYKEAREKYQTEKVSSEQQQSRINREMMNKVEDFLSGKFDITEGQRQFTDQILGPVKQAGLNAINYLRQEADKTEGGITAAIDQFSKQVQQTGLSMGDAITEMEDRVKQTGVNMSEALNESVSMAKQLNEMGLQSYNRELRKQVLSQAASLGRSSTDPEFLQEMASQMNQKIMESNLQLGQYAAQNRMGIAERTGTGLENAAQMRLGVAERTGQGMEQAAQQRVGLAQDMGQMRMGIAGQQGSQELQYAQAQANMLRDLSLGMAPQQIGIGMDIGSYNQAIAQQRLANTQALWNMPMSQAQMQLQERMAQPTQTQQVSTGLGGLFGGLIGTGLSAYGTIASGMAMSDLAGSLKK